MHPMPGEFVILQATIGSETDIDEDERNGPKTDEKMTNQNRKKQDSASRNLYRNLVESVSHSNMLCREAETSMSRRQMSTELLLAAEAVFLARSYKSLKRHARHKAIPGRLFKRSKVQQFANAQKGRIVEVLPAPAQSGEKSSRHPPCP